jgi:hypothetical protein
MQTLIKLILGDQNLLCGRANTDIQLSRQRAVKSVLNRV